MRSYRTLLLKYRVEKLQPEAVAQLLKIQVEFRRCAWEWARSGGETPLLGMPCSRQAASLR